MESLPLHLSLYGNNDQLLTFHSLCQVSIPRIVLDESHTHISLSKNRAIDYFPSLYIPAHTTHTLANEYLTVIGVAT